VIVEDIVPPTARVVTVNTPLDEPAGTVTLAGTVAGSAADKETTAPLAGAIALSATVPITGFPPTTVELLSDKELRTAPAVTVSDGDCWLFPLRVALIVVEPSATAVIVTAAVDEPDRTVTGVCTVATDGLLLERATVSPPLGAEAASVTVPCTVLPTGMLVALNEIPTRVAVVDGPLGDEPHAATAPARPSTALSPIADWMRWLVDIGKPLPEGVPEQ